MALKKMLLVLTLVAMVLVFASACNTLRGVGKDVEKTGEKIQEVAS